MRRSNRTRLASSCSASSSATKSSSSTEASGAVCGFSRSSLDSGAELPRSGNGFRDARPARMALQSNEPQSRGPACEESARGDVLGGAEAEQSNAANGSITWTSDRSGGCRAKSSPEAADLVMEGIGGKACLRGEPVLELLLASVLPISSCTGTCNNAAMTASGVVLGPTRSTGCSACRRCTGGLWEAKSLPDIASSSCIRFVSHAS
mmetsp:Transcript_18105/g.41995  ORF Transcript_18105/g.41995 Transcript_18105/m.41995 type:complete len:207 (+) Transcript_18105:2526-3146(+)